ncbi:hypothetical protein ACFLVO_00965 [Chloroflexota bacterium]
MIRLPDVKLNQKGAIPPLPPGASPPPQVILEKFFEREKDERTK